MGPAFGARRAAIVQAGDVAVVTVVVAVVESRLEAGGALPSSRDRIHARGARHGRSALGPGSGYSDDDSSAADTLDTDRDTRHDGARTGTATAD